MPGSPLALVAIPNGGNRELENSNAGGDLLRLCNVGGELFMEGSVGGCPNNYTNPNSGPFGGEFYFGDYFGDIESPIHGETTVGGIALHPTRGEVAVAAYDAFNTSLVSGGINWFNNETGAPRDPGYLIFFGFGTSIGPLADGSLGKANGLGDVEIFCEPLPIQIGNYAWIDENMDGVQDACEPPVTDLDVILYTKNDDGSLTQVDMTTTDPVTGEYYFDDVEVNTDYLIVFQPEVVNDTTYRIDDAVYTLTGMDTRCRRQRRPE